MSYYPPVSVSFTVSITGGLPPYTVTMNFGDGTTPQSTSTSSTTVTFSHTYNTSGSFTAQATVKDSIGQSASAQTTINVASPITVYQLSVSLQSTVQSSGSRYKIQPITAGYTKGRIW